MAALPALRHVACVAALNASVQGLVGIVLGVLALCVCFCALGTAPQSQNNNDLAQYLTSYLQGDECHPINLYTGVTSATALRVWMALSLFFSASMFVSSLVLFVAVARHWSDEKLQITLVSWLFINTFTAVDDVILGYVFGNDYFKALDSSSVQPNLGPLTLGLVTFLAVRGLYLWLLNLAFIVFLFSGARALHKYLNEQIGLPSLDQEPIESWPTLDDFGKIKALEIERTPTAINHTVADGENGHAGAYPEYTAMARWPSLNGAAQTVREPRPDRAREDARERRAKTVKEYNFRRQDGLDNPAYENESKYFLRLQSETGSTRDYEDFSSVDQPPKMREREPRVEVPRNLDRSKREISDDSTSGHYKQKTPDPWKEKRIPPPPAPGYLEENGIPIPPVDYLDEPSTPSMDRPLSLQEAIVDRTLRLKKVPEALRKGL